MQPETLSLTHSTDNRTTTAFRFTDFQRNLEPIPPVQEKDGIQEFLEDAAIGFQWISSDGIIRWVNQIQLQLLGYRADEYVGQPIAQFFEEEQVGADFCYRLGRGENVRSLETNLVCKDGSFRKVLIRAYAQSQAAGSFGVKCFVQKISDCKEHLEAVERVSQEVESRVRGRTLELTKANLELQRSNQELENYAYVVSHDLREPMRMISNYVGMLTKKYSDVLDSNAQAYLGYIGEGSRRMSDLLEDLLSYSRTGTRLLKFEKVDCEVVLAHVLAGLKLSIEESEAVITRDPLPTIRGDISLIGQLFQNLVANAIKFRKSSETPRIHISAKKDLFEWVFCVSDDGIGIDARHSERIFMLFQRLHPQGDYPGTGVGLATCKKILERHSGRIWVESARGEGARFYFAIPFDLKPPS
jgi:PAS domain S-box-containing protein